MKKKPAPGRVASNKKAYHEYHILEKFEAGIELFGTEVKSIRQGNVSLKESFCLIKDGELFVQKMHIAPYEQGNIFNRDPLRPKKLLMHRSEINKLNTSIKQDGLTLIPTSIYFKKSKVKVEVALAKGKKLHDKRETITQRDSERELERKIKDYNR